MLELARKEAAVGAQDSQDVTGLLQAWSKGDPAALETLIPLVSAELHRLAHRYLNRRRPAATLETTSLVNEAYIRLIAVKQANWHDRAHFYALCAAIMRGILVNHARARLTAKRGGGVHPALINDELAESVAPGQNLVAIDDALTELSKVDPRRGRVVELRFFGGLTVEETAEVLEISSATVMRDWTIAKLWLTRELTRGKFRAPRPVDANCRNR